MLDDVGEDFSECDEEVGNISHELVEIRDVGEVGQARGGVGRVGRQEFGGVEGGRRVDAGLIVGGGQSEVGQAGDGGQELNQVVPGDQLAVKHQRQEGIPVHAHDSRRIKGEVHRALHHQLGKQAPGSLTGKRQREEKKNLNVIMIFSFC